MTECRAGCCRGPLLLELTSGEVRLLRRAAARLKVRLHLEQRDDGSGWLKFTDHEGERCPMLAPDSFACRIYYQRPRRCRDFPQRPTPGCRISGC